MLQSKFRAAVAAALALSVSVGLFCAARSRAADAAEAAEVVSRLKSDLSYLADDEREGRGVGTEGLTKAAEYVRDQFAKAGLDVTRVDGGAFQTFTLPNGSELADPNRVVFVSPDGEETALTLGEDFQVCSFGGSGNVDAELVFCGYGIDNDKIGYNDFADLDLKGKIAIIMRRTPQQGQMDSPFGGPHGGISRDAELRTKVSHAFGHGAAGVLFVNDPYSDRSKKELAEQQLGEAKDNIAEAAGAFVDADTDEAREEARKKLDATVKRLRTLEKIHGELEDDPLMPFGYAGTGKADDLPIAHISQQACSKLLTAALGKSLADLEAEIDSDLKPRSTVLKGWKGALQTSIQIRQSAVHNVIGVLEGEGPLADETIVIGAHYDHVGYGGQGSLSPGSKDVHNGADDNASGTVALVELARRFATAEQKPARRLVFIAFTAEELGLIGSAHYVKEPVFPLEQTIAMFNMDMVGRLTEDKLTVFGTGTSPRWKPLVVKTGEEYGFRLSMQPEGFGPSDHSSFYGKKIPVLHFFTGTHSDYHRPSDDYDKINYEGIARVADMVQEIVQTTLQDPEHPEYVEIKQRANIGRSGSRPYFGSVPDFGTEGKGYAISATTPGSPAEKAGLKGGDRIIQIGEIKVNSLDDFDLALRRFSPGDEVDVKVLRDGEEQSFKLTLAQPR